jgi:hypothetical protein
MRKLYFFLSILLGLSFQSFSQCTPANVSSVGIFPDSATNFAPAFQNTPYSQVITANVPADTAIAPPPIPPVPVAYVKLVSLSGLPDGLSYACVPSNCEFPGGATNCAVIQGTPIDPPGTYTLNIVLEPFVGNPPASAGTYTLDYYKIVVNPPSAIIENGKPVFQVLQNSPNPASNIANISYSIPSAGQVEFRLYNALGKVMQQKQFYSVAGLHQMNVDVSSLAPGIYLYSFVHGGQVQTRRMVVSAK